MATGLQLTLSISNFNFKPIPVLKRHIRDHHDHDHREHCDRHNHLDLVLEEKASISEWTAHQNAIFDIFWTKINDKNIISLKQKGSGMASEQGQTKGASDDTISSHFCTSQESSSARYILQQYTAASGGQKLQNSVHNAYAMGRVTMIASEFEKCNKVTRNRNSSKGAESGGFVLWQMNPDMWFVELVLGGSKVCAGCNGRLVWRHTPWLGAHAAKGPVRPLHRALQVKKLPVITHYTKKLH
ncbi:hypothetical protein LWI29_030290 [Acer saccharum]|uniref:Uncharacterized protein n=1 Tax=Acer saccharum TaxID=4024 RepID=A0AA39RIL9_ACESA|nr:hypothetical protein LWI29_030290 [Acer saccharum]